MNKRQSTFVYILVLFGIILIPVLFWAIPVYSVWQQGMSGQAKLREAEYSRQVQIEEAKANLEAERLNAEAEIVRARGAAEAIQIEAGSLTENYIRYLWVRRLELAGSQVIYVPTEGGLPLLEANRLQP